MVQSIWTYCDREGLKIMEIARKKRVVLGLNIFVVVLLVGLILYFVQSSHILHRTAKSISPNGNIKYVIYDMSLKEESDKKSSDFITVQEYDLSEDDSEWKLLNETELSGDYIESSWSWDSRLFVVSVDSKEANLYIFDTQKKSVRKLDNFLDMQLINRAAFNSGLYEQMLSVNKDTKYEFVQWAEHGDKMLVQYTVLVPESEKEDSTEYEGYFWYDYEKDIIEGYMDNTY